MVYSASARLLIELTGLQLPLHSTLGMLKEQVALGRDGVKLKPNPDTCCGAMQEILEKHRHGNNENKRMWSLALQLILTTREHTVDVCYLLGKKLKAGRRTGNKSVALPVKLRWATSCQKLILVSIRSTGRLSELVGSQLILRYAERQVTEWNPLQKNLTHSSSRATLTLTSL